MGRTKKSISETVQAAMPEFADEVVGLSVQDLNNRLATLAKDAERVETAKEEDEELAQAKGHTSELSAPYRDAKKDIRLKSKYIIGLIKDKGGDA